MRDELRPFTEYLLRNPSDEVLTLGRLHYEAVGIRLQFGIYFSGGGGCS